MILVIKPYINSTIMKSSALISKTFSLIVITCMLQLTSNAQKEKVIEKADYKNAIGVRLGLSTGISYKHKFDAYNAMEIIAGTHPHAIALTALYERNVLTNIDGLALYFGGGAHVSRAYFSSWENSNSPEKDQYYYYSKNYHYAPIIGIDVIGGVEYKFQNIPLALSFDLKPYAEYYKGYGPYFRLDPGAGVKFTF